MKYFGITQHSADWLLNRKGLREVLHDILKEPEALRPLEHADFIEGPLRIVGSSDGELVALWNVDYLSGTGEEPWGLIRLAEPAGLFAQPRISREVFERCLYVINQRLQALLIDSAFIHRNENGIHTCLAGRGDEARQFNIAFKELTFGTGAASIRSIVCVGPLWNFDDLRRAANAEFGNLHRISMKADEITSPVRKRPVLDTDYFPNLRLELQPTWQRDTPAVFEALETQTEMPPLSDVYRTVHWTYDDWIRKGSPLSKLQRGILESDALDRHPIRIIGPGGSGKTLLMLLITMRILTRAEEERKNIRVLYIVHNQQMATKIRERFSVLGGDRFLVEGGMAPELHIRTLSTLARNQLELEDQVVIDIDAEKTKEFQFETVKEALDETLQARTDLTKQSASNLLEQVQSNDTVREAFARLIMAEVSVAIKAHELHEDRRRYVQSERPLSRLHGILSAKEREFVYSVFEAYHRRVFEEFQVLDSDDLAISFLGKLRTPISQLRRRTDAFDYVMVDETQLFNENERRIFPLLAKSVRTHVPIALALDEAQEPYGNVSAGLGVLGIDRIENETLPNSHRSTREIIELAFYILQQTTDLFSADFPDYTQIGRSMTADNHPATAAPVILECGDEVPNVGRFVARRVSDLRRENVRQIAVVCHADMYWHVLEEELRRNRDLPLHVLRQRGENLTPDQPVVVLSRPQYIGGQEFDAVVLVGLEQGIAPPLIRESPALGAALEQQVLREMYLSLTRARYRVIVALAPGASPNGTLFAASEAGLIQWERRRRANR